MKFNGVTLTDETIQKTREWYAENARLCAEEASRGAFFVNDLESYVQERLRVAEATLRGENDYTVAFLQRAYFIQTGESVALLP